jgi:hypothetical protein
MWFCAQLTASPLSGSWRSRRYEASSVTSGKCSASSGGTGTGPWSRRVVRSPDCWATMVSTEPSSRTGRAVHASGSMKVPRRRCRDIRPSVSSSFSACRMVRTLTP